MKIIKKGLKVLGYVFLSLVLGGTWYVVTVNAACTQNFPVSLNSWVSGNVICSSWANSIETSIGITNSASSTSLQWQVNNINVTTASGTLPITRGGTNAQTSSTARSNLGLAIGTNVQAWNVRLDQISTIATTTGNLIVASSSVGWTALATGTNSQVLTSSSTAANGLGVAWQTPTAAPLVSASHSASTGGGATQYLTVATSSSINAMGANDTLKVTIWSGSNVSNASVNVVANGTVIASSTTGNTGTFYMETTAWNRASTTQQVSWYWGVASNALNQPGAFNTYNANTGTSFVVRIDVYGGTTFRLDAFDVEVLRL